MIFQPFNFLEDLIFLGGVTVLQKSALDSMKAYHIPPHKHPKILHKHYARLEYFMAS